MWAASALGVGVLERIKRGERRPLFSLKVNSSLHLSLLPNCGCNVTKSPMFPRPGLLTMVASPLLELGREIKTKLPVVAFFRYFIMTMGKITNTGPRYSHLTGKETEAPRSKITSLASVSSPKVQPELPGRAQSSVLF